MKHFIFKHILWIGMALIMVVVLREAMWPGPGWQVTASFIVAILSFIYFAQKQYLEETKFFMELFTEFNNRYRTYNEALNRIRQGNYDAELSPADLNLLYDYFNLCGEEYLMWKKGYLYPEVWNTWCKGIKIFLGNERIKKVWDEEMRTYAYYGLKL